MKFHDDLFGSLWLLQIYGRKDRQALRRDENAPKKRTSVFTSRPWSKRRWLWRNNPRLCSQLYRSCNLDRLPYMGKEDVSLHGPRKNSDNRHTVSVRASDVYRSRCCHVGLHRFNGDICHSGALVTEHAQRHGTWATLDGFTKFISSYLWQTICCNRKEYKFDVILTVHRR